MKFPPPPSPGPTTLKPTSPMPTHSLLPDGKKRLLVVVTLDEFPEDTGWSLATLDGGDVIFEVPIGTYEANDRLKRYEYEFEVDGDMFYQLKIKDQFADGFGGTIDVYAGAIISSKTRLVQEPGFGSEYGKEVTHVFFVGDDPANILTLVFNFDPFADEVAFELKDSRGNILALMWFDSFEKGTESARVEIPIYSSETGDQSYSLTLYDWGSNGICCGGGYELFLGSPEENNLLKSGGDYGTDEMVQFTVKGFAPSMSPSPAPSVSPSGLPTNHPTVSQQPSTSMRPTFVAPSMSPSTAPSVSPSGLPTNHPTVSQQPTTSMRPTFAMIGKSAEANRAILQINENDESNMNQTPSSSAIQNWRSRIRLVYFSGLAATLLLLV
jgi:hypothetical protein